MLSETSRFKMDEIMKRIKAGGGQAAIDEAVNLFNARPMRRETDLRIQGWKVVQS